MVRLAITLSLVGFAASFAALFGARGSRIRVS
jgi:hypothetical protein